MTNSIKDFAGYTIYSPSLESTGLNGKVVERAVRKAFPNDDESALYIVKVKGVRSHCQLYEDEMCDPAKRDIRVEYKHFVYSGSKSSDLLMAFDLFFSHFPEYDTEDGIYFNIDLSRSDMKRMLDFIQSNSGIYKNADELLEKINNIYIRMVPNDFVEVDIY